MLRNSARAGAALALVLSSFSSGARASGPVEAFVAAARHPSEPGRLVVQYSNTGTRTGLLFSSDAGESFSLLCTAAMAEEALSALPALPSADADMLRSSFSRARVVRMTGDGSLLVGSSAGLFVDKEKGCAFRRADVLAGLWIAGLALDPNDAAVSYVITNGGSPAGNEGLWRRNADGSFDKLASFAPAAGDESWTVSGLQVVELAGGGLRFYTVQVRYVPATQELTSHLLYSDDAGANWTAHQVAVPPQAGLSLLAVDPTDAERVVLRITRSDDSNEFDLEKDTLLVSDDAGASVRNYLDVTEVGGVLFEADGTLWVADAGKTSGGGLPVGLYRAAPGLSEAPARVLSDRPITCLAEGPESGLLFVCSRYSFGSFDTAEQSFSSLVTTQTVPVLHSCADQDVVADCRDQLCESGWCGPGHFSVAPFCAAYDEPYCGNDADNYGEQDAGVDGGAADGSDGGADAGSLDADGDSPIENPPTPFGDGGASPPVAGKSESGCACSVGAARDRSPLTLWAALAALSAVWLRRARRERSAHSV